MLNDFTIPSQTNQGNLFVRVWQPDGETRAVLQIVHGMAEHMQRYEEFAEFLKHNGILVVGNDISSHGKSSIDGDDIHGYFGEKDGWSNLVGDIRNVYQKVKAQYPFVPYILMGHSMGSFLARSYAGRNGDDMDAFVFSGTAGKNPALPIAKLIAQNEIKKKGAKTPSAILDSLSFGAYNNAFKPNRTRFDWLSRDSEQVDKYVNDPLCGFVFTASAFKDLFDGLSEIQDIKWAKLVPDKPIMLISGTADPVGGKQAKGVKQVADMLVETGHRVELNLYENARHELLNEINKDIVYADILDFINRV
ncbi:MAG: alpha/beta hydrolase [Clostridia bacterium]